MKKYAVIVCLLLFVACKKESEPLAISFYFWRTTFNLTAVEQQYLNDLAVKKLYIRYFDVDLQNNDPIPVAPIIFDKKPENYEVVPVVYIKNRVFLQEQKTDSLAVKIYKFINQINQSANVSVKEIQFDCDWSVQSKQNYFQFIDHFKKIHPNITATIRLHQIKYPTKTGIPNVTSGTLMYYNMDVIGSGDNNSIYNKKTAQRYVGALKNYKLPLNIALPIFSWGVHIRNHQVTNLIGSLRVDDLETEHFKKINENRFLVTKDVVFKGRYLAKNDEIKIEQTSVADLKEMLHDIKKNSKQKPNEIIFYDLNQNNLKAYEKEDFKTVSRW